MKTLFESLLDDEETIINTSNNIASQKVKDKYDIINLYIENGNWSDVNVPKYFNWKQIQKDAKNNHWEISKGWTVKSSSLKTDVGGFISALKNQYLLGFEQNMLSYFKQVLKDKYQIEYELNKRAGGTKLDLIYHITPKKHTGDPTDDLDMNFVLKSKN